MDQGELKCGGEAGTVAELYGATDKTHALGGSYQRVGGKWTLKS